MSSCSSLSSSSSCSGGKGGQWTSKIYFDSEADQWRGDPYFIEDEKLIKKLKTLVDPNEEIVKVYAYKHKLSNWQLTSFFMYHLFIVFKTKQWWWSIEKNSEGITIQRSKYLWAVKDKHRQKDRASNIWLVQEDEGRNSVIDLIEWLYKENELNKKYTYYSSNCKTFAKRVFYHVSKTITLYWYHGAFTFW